MSGNKCAYIKCGNSRYHTPNLKMFSFPVKNSERCETWKTHSGNLKVLDLKPEDLRKMFICEVHFSSNSFINANKHRLVHDAVPVPYENSFIPIKTESSSSQIPDKGMIKDEVIDCSQQQRSNYWENDVISPIIKPKNTYAKAILGL